MITPNSNENPTLNGTKTTTQPIMQHVKPQGPNEIHQSPHAHMTYKKNPWRNKCDTSQGKLHWERNICKPYLHDNKHKQDKNRIYFQEVAPREHLLKMQTGYSAIRVVSINPDNFLGHQAQREITNMILSRKIHIAAIQETHYPHESNYIFN